MINKRRLNGSYTPNTNVKNPFLANNTASTPDNNSVENNINNIKDTIIEDDTNSSNVEGSFAQLEDNNVSPTVDDSMLGSYANTANSGSESTETSEAEENNTTLSKMAHGRHYCSPLSLLWSRRSHILRLTTLWAT